MKPHPALGPGRASLLLLVFVLTLPRLAAQDLEAEKALTKQRMLRLYEAIQEYRKEFKELPPSLGDLHPRYVPDLETFLCPTAERTGHTLPFEALVDPKIRTHIGYEFSLRPMGSIWGGRDLRMRDFKQMQMLLVGGQVPMLRCFAYGENAVLNVTFDGTFLETPLTWETLWEDRLPPGAFSPENLLARVASLLPENASGAELEWIRLRPQLRQEAIYEVLQKDGPEAAAARALELSARVDAFLEKYPQSRSWGEACQAQRNLLMTAAQSKSEGVATAWTRSVERARAHAGLNDQDRYQLDRDGVQFAAMRQFAAGGQAAALRELAEGLKGIIRNHPTQEEPYQQLLMMAADAGLDEGEVAREIDANPKAPDGAREAARATLGRERLLASPLDLRFTALDGRAVDLTTLRGKVVLLDFWATWCGPCIAELPNVLEVYRKYHAQGFEIVGISFDEDRQALEQFVARRQMPWPQFFDGKGWGNQYGRMFGIRGIPAMWLLDETGRVVDRAARGESLGSKVERLLAARPKA